jgi:hypothetical protein
MESKSPAPREAVRKWSTWAILAEPYLDTENTQEYKDALMAELRERGITGFSLLWRRVITASGLWWNVLWWEWALFDGRDIAYGWALNLVLLGALIIPWFFGWIYGLVFFIVGLLAVRPFLKVIVRVLWGKMVEP